MSSSFHEVQFPPDISYGATGGPGYSTGVVTMPSKGEQRSQNWAQSRCSYNVAQGVKNQAQLDALIAFYRNRKGKAFGFRFKDWTDFTAVKQVCVAVEEPVHTYQLQKVYTDAAGFIETRRITKPVSGTVKVYGDEVLLTDGYAVDYTKGLITLAYDLNPYPIIVTADFEFDVPVRFDSDEMPISLDTFSTYSWSGITVIEIGG